MNRDLITITIRTLLPELRDRVKLGTSMEELQRLFRALPYSGVYARVEGHCTGIHRHGPRLFISTDPGPWRAPDNAVLIGEEFWLAVARAFWMEVIEHPAAAPIPEPAPVRTAPAVQGTLF